MPYAPALQGEHEPAVPPDQVPAGHALHAAFTPGYTPPDVEKEPGAQAPVHVALVLLPTPYVPALQGVHADVLPEPAVE